ncbi:MAG TPA: hypothetical protein VHD36_13610 [Pirellulales bacterium]|nr:hypothetical protein [Pirellulales bacterium]
MLVPALVAFGCSRAEQRLPTRHVVKGSVTYNGQPLQGATVTFWPMPVDTHDWRAVRPIAIVDSDGTFAPNSYSERDGAVPGDYAVTLIYRASRASPDVFRGRYADPEKPLLTVIVGEGENILPPIKLEGPPLARMQAEPDSGN